MLNDVTLPEGIDPEVMSHLMSPRNYGKLDTANCIGVANDEKTGEYVIFYTQLEGSTVKNVMYATNGCQDTVVIGSMFTDMIIGNDVDYAQNAVERMNEKLGDMTPEQQVCADIVFTAFSASLINFNNKIDGKDEEMHLLLMKETCAATNMPENKENNE